MPRKPVLLWQLFEGGLVDYNPTSVPENRPLKPAPTDQGRPMPRRLGRFFNEERDTKLVTREHLPDL